MAVDGHDMSCEPAKVERFASRRWARRAAFAISMGSSFMPSACEPARTFVVTTIVDGEPGSLRSAINEANRATGTSPVTIELPTGTYVLRVCRSDDDNTGGDLDVTLRTPVTLIGTGPNVIISQGCEGERVLDASGSSILTIRDILITQGRLQPANAGAAAMGGGVRAQGDLYLERSAIFDNAAVGAPGSVNQEAGTAMDAGLARGGGLFVGGSLLAVDSVLSSNVAVGGNGEYTPIAEGLASAGGSAEGAAAYVVGAVVIRGGSMQGNRAEAGTGGDAARYPGLAGSARGGAIAQAETSTAAVVLENTYIADNHAFAGGLGSVQAISLEPGMVLRAGNARGGAVASAGTLTVRRSELRRNHARGAAIGRCPIDLDCRGGEARGGALATRGAADIVDSTLEANEATSGHSVYVCFGNGHTCRGTHAAPARGGAVWAERTLTASGGRFALNVVTQGRGAADADGAGSGGALASDAAIRIEGGEYLGNRVIAGRGGAISGRAVSLSGATVSGNLADGRGGGVDAETLTARAVTAERNEARGSGGGAFAARGDTTIADCIVRDNLVNSLQLTSAQVLSGGGGIRVDGHLTVSTTLVSGNRGFASLWNSIECAGCSVTFAGGGIWAESLVAESVTLSGNFANGQTMLGSSSGSNAVIRAGVSGGGAIAASGAVALVNTTLSGNRVSAAPSPLPSGVAPARGAGVLAEVLELDHATVVDNENAPALAVAELASQRSVVVTGSGHSVCSGVGQASGAHNWFGDASCNLLGTGNQQTSTELRLSALADNGGPVPTRLPETGSVLIDRIPVADCPSTRDARGVLRPQGAGCDVGAVEVVSEEE